MAGESQSMKVDEKLISIVEEWYENNRKATTLIIIEHLKDIDVGYPEEQVIEKAIDEVVYLAQKQLLKFIPATNMVDIFGYLLSKVCWHVNATLMRLYHHDL